jgi:hypothetical protein
VPLSYPGQDVLMGEGRLVRVSRYRGDPHGTAYLVAVPDREAALKLVAEKAANPGDEIEDLGRVSANLILVMALAPGEFVPIKGVGHVAQQQQQIQQKADQD